MWSYYLFIFLINIEYNIVPQTLLLLNNYLFVAIAAFKNFGILAVDLLVSSLFILQKSPTLPPQKQSQPSHFLLRRAACYSL